MTTLLGRQPQRTAQLFPAGGPVPYEVAIQTIPLYDTRAAIRSRQVLRRRKDRGAMHATCIVQAH